jgi:hypothetical protein
MRRFAVLVAMVPAAAFAVTPVNGGQVDGTIVVINNGPGNHTYPHVSVDVAAYTEGTSSTSIRYYRFSTAVDTAVPSVSGATDSLSDISGNNIVFTRGQGGCSSILAFNVATGATTEVAPVAPAACPQRLGAAIGNTTVAFIDYGSGAGVTFVADVAGGPAVQLSSGAGTTQAPEVASNGNAVVWEQCSSLTSCNVMKSIRAGGAWGAAAMVVASASNPDTDGNNVVYDASRAGNATGRDLYFQPLAGGAETQLQIAGEQSNPSISAGVFGFESRPVPGSPADIFIYVIATNTMYQVTNTPTIDDRLNDVKVLPTGEVRVVWASNDGLFGSYNVYGRTFTVPLGPPNPCGGEGENDDGNGDGEHNNGADCDGQDNDGPHDEQHGDPQRGDAAHSSGGLSAARPAMGCSAAGDLAPLLVLAAVWLAMPRAARARNSRRS